jgi:hypothetical protein
MASAKNSKPSIELLLSISATLLSLAALIVSIFQTNIAREQTLIARQQQQASVWPHLQADFTKAMDNFEWAIINNGVGPAIVQSMEVSYQGKSYQQASTLVDLQIQKVDRIKSFQVALFYASIESGDVIKNDDKLVLVRQEKNMPVADTLLRMIQDTSYHLRVTYSDVYHNCWLLDYNQNKSQITPLANCTHQ